MFANKEEPHPRPSTASPPSPLRMERGVNTTSRMGEDG